MFSPHSTQPNLLQALLKGYLSLLLTDVCVRTYVYADVHAEVMYAAQAATKPNK